MGIKNDVFGLEQLYVLQVEGNWSVKSDAWQTEASAYRQAHPFGYFVGGNRNTLVDRIDYTNDTATASTKGDLSNSHDGNHASTGNSSFGYVASGGSISIVDRIDYSNDTATSSVRGPLNFVRGQFTATGNNSFGYFGAGKISGARVTTVERISYSNDTATASPKGPLSFARISLGATGNSSFGYFGGGYDSNSGSSSTDTSIVDRINYSNDTATASPKGPLSRVRVEVSATGNGSFGYFIAGYDNGSAVLSSIDRIDFSK